MLPSPLHAVRWLLAFSVLAVLGAWPQPLGAQVGLSAPSVPALTGRVVDRAELLSDATETVLTQRLADHEAETSNQVAVLTIPSLGGQPIEAYSLNVARTWALGQAGDDNGVLLLIAHDDHAMRIEVGYGLEGALPDVVASRIIRHELRPAFRAGDFDGGVEAGVTAILEALEGTYEATSSTTSSEEMPLFARLIFGLMFVLMPLGLFAPSFLIAGRWGSLLFVSIFVTVGCGIVFFSLWGAVVGAAGYWLLAGVGEWAFRRQAGWKDERRQVREVLDENRGRRVEIDIAGLTYTAGGITSGSGSGGGGSGGGSSGGGGGFSGGGGSFGGGGASGGW